MKTRKLFMRAMAVALAVIMVVAAAVPAFAAGGDDLTITIKPHPDTMGPDLSGRVFYAYQIFSGTPAEDTNKSLPSEDDRWGATSWNNWTLTDIEWGINVNGSELIKALILLDYDAEFTYYENNAEGEPELKTSTIGKTWPEFFNNQKKNIFIVNSMTNDTTAEEFAQFLVDKSNAFLQELCAFIILGKDRTIPKSAEEYDGYLKDAQTVRQSVLQEDGSLLITVPSAGYYLIAEGEEGSNFEGYDIYSEYMLAVLGNQTIYEKAQLPTLEKDIVNPGSDGSNKGDFVATGEVVTFRLTGTLPAEQWETFLKYDYIFEDVTYAGLTFNEVTSVTVVCADETTKYTLDNSSNNPLNYAAYEVVNSQTGITITMHDLKQPLPFTATTKEPVPESKEYTVQGTDTIIVEYTATVNDDAILSKDGTQNHAKVVYSNDPDTDSHGETLEQTVYLYTFGLDFSKVGSDNHDKGLTDAGFVLYNDQKDKIAKFEKTTPQFDSESYVFQEWETLTTDIKDNISKLQDAQKALSSDPDNSEFLENLATAKQGLVDYLLCSDGEGGTFSIKGLDTGTYYLSEALTPIGYNTFDTEIEIKIAATLYDKVEGDHQIGQLKSVTYSINGDIVVQDGKEYQQGTTVQYWADTGGGMGEVDGGPWDQGPFGQTLVNEKAPFLPFTGGVGTIVFYAAGGVLIVGALIYLVIASKKRKNRTDA